MAEWNCSGQTIHHSHAAFNGQSGSAAIHVPPPEKQNRFRDRYRGDADGGGLSVAQLIDKELRKAS